MWIPPIGVRRIFFDPIVFVIAVVIIVVSPVFFLSAFVVDLVSPGRWKFVRSTRLMVVLSLCEVVGLIAALADWLICAFGLTMRRPRFVVANYVCRCAG